MKILVPVDGSPASTRALALAIDQLKPLVGAGLILVNVQNFATLGLAEGAGIMSTAWIEQEEEKAATEALQEAVAACREAGVTYVTRSERGAPCRGPKMRQLFFGRARGLAVKATCGEAGATPLESRL